MAGLTVCVLASGSSGNCLFVGTDTTRVLVDAGLSGRETARRLGQIGVDIASVQAVCLTHEHSDHIAGLKALQSRHGLRLFANSGTVEAVRADSACRDLEWQVFEAGSSFPVGDLRVEAFSVPHDAADPVGFVLEAGGVRLAVALDLGTPTTLVRRRMRDCRLLVLESNHDARMLEEADRPWPLKQRILGRQGHLSNQAAGELLAEVAGPALTDVFLGHLSPECNRPELAQAAAQKALREAGHEAVRVRLTYPDRVSDVWTV